MSERVDTGRVDPAQRQRRMRAALPMAVWLLLMPTMPFWTSAAEPPGAAPSPLTLPAVADGANVAASPQAQQLAGWITQTNDHAGLPFIIVDKKRASVLVYEPDARLRAHSAVLLGLARGDDSVPGIGERPMAQIKPEERTTPAGRFVAERGRNAQGEDIVWVDYDAAISMHRVRTGNALERRAQRLSTPGIGDNRISYGCINVPVAFYEKYISPIFATSKAMVYVLPESKPLHEAFDGLQAQGRAVQQAQRK